MKKILGFNADVGSSDFYTRQIQSFIRRRRIDGVAALGDALEKGADKSLVEDFIEAVTINTTSFFREMPHYEWIYDTGLPELLRSGVGGGRVSIWSAACSSGQELYSALMVADRFRRSSGRQLQVTGLGTDVSNVALNNARMARYSKIELSQIPNPYRDLYVSGRDDGEPRLSTSVKAMAEWQHNNLNAPSRSIGAGRFSMIFLRNCMIYFGKAERDRILTRVTAQLAPGGYLFVGHSETQSLSSFPLKQVTPAVFSKVG
ncbi:MAG: protein-glutamate O-methyltransferase CheR [Pseudomonadota bacterium]